MIEPIALSSFAARRFTAAEFFFDRLGGLGRDDARLTHRSRRDAGPFSHSLDGAFFLEERRAEFVEKKRARENQLASRAQPARRSALRLCQHWRKPIDVTKAVAARALFERKVCVRALFEVRDSRRDHCALALVQVAPVQVQAQKSAARGRAL